MPQPSNFRLILVSMWCNCQPKPRIWQKLFLDFADPKFHLSWQMATLGEQCLGKILPIYILMKYISISISISIYLSIYLYICLSKCTYVYNIYIHIYIYILIYIYLYIYTYIYICSSPCQLCKMELFSIVNRWESLNIFSKYLDLR